MTRNFFSSTTFRDFPINFFIVKIRAQGSKAWLAPANITMRLLSLVVL